MLLCSVGRVGCCFFVERLLRGCWKDMEDKLIGETDSFIYLTFLQF